MSQQFTGQYVHKLNYSYTNTVRPLNPDFLK